MKNRGSGACYCQLEMPRRISVPSDHSLHSQSGESVFEDASANRMSAPIGSSVGVGWENNIPELWRGRQELDGNERSLLVHLRRTYNIHFHALLCSWIFEGELSALGDAFGKNNHGPAGAHRVSKSLYWLGVFGKVDDHGHTQENTLRAPALFRRRLPRLDGAHRAYRTRFRVRRRLHV